MARPPSPPHPTLISVDTSHYKRETLLEEKPALAGSSPGQGQISECKKFLWSMRSRGGQTMLRHWSSQGWHPLMKWVLVASLPCFLQTVLLLSLVVKSLLRRLLGFKKGSLLEARLYSVSVRRVSSYQTGLIVNTKPRQHRKRLKKATQVRPRRLLYKLSRPIEQRRLSICTQNLKLRLYRFMRM